MIRHMTTRRLETWLEAGETESGRDFLLVNVLDEDRFLEGRIPGSRNVSVKRDDLVDEVRRLAGSRAVPVVVYCSSEECEASPRAAERLIGAGFATVWDYSGGLRAWAASGHDLASGPPES